MGSRNRFMLDTGKAFPDTGKATVDNRSGRSRSEQVTNTTRFDTNMVIILAALLCALVLALGLNSLVRCAFRCTRRFSDAHGDTAASGLKKSALRRMPVAVYGSAGMSMPETECSICLGDFEDGEKVRVLPRCNHGFHVTCIDTWLLSHSSSCPNCRHSLVDPEQEQPHTITTISNSP